LETYASGALSGHRYKDATMTDKELYWFIMGLCVGAMITIAISDYWLGLGLQPRLWDVLFGEPAPC